MPPRQSRRHFLTVVGGAGVANALASGCSGDEEAPSLEPEPIGDVAAGNISELPVPSLRAVGTIAVAIGRDEAGVYAMTLNCTHARCNIATNGLVGVDGVLCGCHGSRFSANGEVTMGPARRPLVHYAVESDADGNLTIRGAAVVTAETRLIVS